MNIIVPIPKATPKRDESPLITPMFAPVDVNMKLLGPGVTAATMENRKKATACYLMMRRLDFARRQLSTARPLSELALMAGFSNQAHFTRTFKAGLGLTPAAYKHLIAKA